MGHIKEPVGVDLNLEPMPITPEDRIEISAIISRYKSTGETPNLHRESRAKRKSSAVATNKPVRAKTTVAKRKPTALEPDK